MIPTPVNPASKEGRLDPARVFFSRRLFRIAAIGIFWFLATAAGAWLLVFRPAQRLDEEKAQREADICQAFLATEMARLRATALDWANWDDLEQYLNSSEEKFAVENVTQTALRNLDIDGMLLVKKDGNLQRREVAGPNKSLYMGSANFLERTASLRSLAAEKGASATVVGGAGHIYAVAVAPVLGTDATGPSSGEVIVFSILTDADLGNHPGLKGATIELLPPDTKPLEKNMDGDTAEHPGSVVTRSLVGHDGTEAARLFVYQDNTHTELAREAAIFFAASGVLLAVMLHAFSCAGAGSKDSTA